MKDVDIDFGGWWRDGHGGSRKEGLLTLVMFTRTYGVSCKYFPIPIAISSCEAHTSSLLDLSFSLIDQVGMTYITVCGYMIALALVLFI